MDQKKLQEFYNSENMDIEIVGNVFEEQKWFYFGLLT